MDDWEEGYFTAVADSATNIETWAKMVNDQMLENGIRREILTRKFEPITGYEPDPKREEWVKYESCECCPWAGLPLFVTAFPTQLWCRVNREAHEYACGWHDQPHKGCRFSEYRQILFRRFDR